MSFSVNSFAYDEEKARTAGLLEEEDYNEHTTRKNKSKTITMQVWQLTVLIVILVAVSLIAFLGWVLHAPCSPSSAPPPPHQAINFGPSYEIGSPAILPDGDWTRFTFLHMNDVYELMPLNGGTRGGLARVAAIRQLLMKENPNTITVLAGDLISPSALGTTNMTTIDNKLMNGRQMISTMNSLGLDFACYGNHEFDLAREDSLDRIKQSKFQWLSMNVFDNIDNQIFGHVPTHKIIVIDGIRILLFGLTVDNNLGIGMSGPYHNLTGYVTIVSALDLVPLLQNFFSRPDIIGSYDISIGLTHLDIGTDILLVETIPQIDIIMGGHEHEDYYIQRGPRYTPIYKADDNAFSVYIHRMAFNKNPPPGTPRLLIHSTLTRVNPTFPDEPQTNATAWYWYQLGMDAFVAAGFSPQQTVAVLPPGLMLDGRMDVVRQYPTLLTDDICNAMVRMTKDYNTTIGLFNTGAIRLDDFLSGTINQYDILRTLPYGDPVVVMEIPGSIIATLLTYSETHYPMNGKFLAYSGIYHNHNDNNQWYDENGQLLNNNPSIYRVATGLYISGHYQGIIGLPILEQFPTNTRALIDYLEWKYNGPSTTIEEGGK